jgi:hypothetical protein
MKSVGKINLRAIKMCVLLRRLEQNTQLAKNITVDSIRTEFYPSQTKIQ